jgi:hypothetical protein
MIAEAKSSIKVTAAKILISSVKRRKLQYIILLHSLLMYKITTQRRNRQCSER